MVQALHNHRPVVIFFIGGNNIEVILTHGAPNSLVTPVKLHVDSGYMESKGAIA